MCLIRPSAGWNPTVRGNRANGAATAGASTPPEINIRRQAVDPRECVQASQPVAHQFERPVDCKEAGQYLRLHPKTVERMARDTELPAHPVGNGRRRHWLFFISELDAWLRSRVISRRHPCCDTGGNF